MIALVWSLNRQVAPLVQNTNAAPSGSTVPQVVPSTESAPVVLTPEEILKVRSQEDVRRLGVIFAERLGSYSNQSQMANMADLYPVMTDQMKAWADKYVADLMKQFGSAKDYQGLTTRVLTSSFKSFDAAGGGAGGKAEMFLATQREKSSKPGKTEVYYQNLTLQFVRPGDSWKVDGAYWEKK